MLKLISNMFAGSRRVLGKVRSSAGRRAPAARLALEACEGRQLLSTFKYVPVNFGLSFTGTDTVGTLNQTTLSYSQAITGTAVGTAHLGRFTFTGGATATYTAFDPLTGFPTSLSESGGTLVLRARGGSVLDLSLTGAGTVNTVSSELDENVQLTITGGTGRFRGLKGTATGVLANPLTPGNTFTAIAFGTFYYAKKVR